MPCNLYGPNDTYDMRASHVIPALIAKAHRAKLTDAPELEVWGTGTPRREFLFVDDLADACVFAMRHYSDDLPLNVGSGEDVTIRELAELICDVVGYRGDLHFEATKPDGTSRKLMDSRRIKALGWTRSTSLREGLAKTYEAFLSGVGRKMNSCMPELATS
jgi:GDP-L-fucose synthase